MKAQKGFVIIHILFLVPLFFSVGVLILTSHRIITKYTEAQRLCREHVLEAQQILGKNLKALLDLNPRAKALRVEENALRTALLAARAFPPVAAVLQARLNVNLTQQGVLRAQQELLITSGKARAYSVLSQLRAKIHSANHSFPVLKVYKTPQNAIAPDHDTLPFFENVQTIRIRWSLPLSHFIPQIVLNLFKSNHYPTKVRGVCAATLVQKGEVWNPKLHLARF